MGWGWPVLKFLWSAFKWVAKNTLKVFAWAWENPVQGAIAGLSIVGIGWLLDHWFGWENVRAYMKSFGWSLVTVSSLSWAGGEIGRWFDRGAEVYGQTVRYHHGGM